MCIGLRIKNENSFKGELKVKMFSTICLKGQSEHLKNWGLLLCVNSVAQKIKKLSETPTTVSIVAKLCKNDIRNKKNAKK